MLIITLFEDLTLNDEHGEIEALPAAFGDIKNIIKVVHLN